MQVLGFKTVALRQMFTGSQCFPTLILYVQTSVVFPHMFSPHRACPLVATEIACCPPSDVVPLQDLILTCPEALHYSSECHGCMRVVCRAICNRENFLERRATALKEYLESRGEFDARAAALHRTSSRVVI